MNKQNHVKAGLLVLAVFVLLGSFSIVLVGSSLALNQENGETTATEQDKMTIEEKRKAAKQEAADRVKKAREALADKQTKLDSTKLKICQAREKQINTLRNGVSNRRDGNLRTLSQLSERIQTFYTNQNLSVANYDTLVATVNEKKTAAEAALAALKAAATSFKCDGNDPRGDGSIFKAEHQKTVAAMKEYKTAVKSLFMAVKEAAKAEQETN